MIRTDTGQARRPVHWPICQATRKREFVKYHELVYTTLKRIADDPKGRAMDFTRDPFLLPLCPCGSATRLSHIEPHPVDALRSLRTYVCQACDSVQTHAVTQRPSGRDERPLRSAG